MAAIQLKDIQHYHKRLSILGRDLFDRCKEGKGVSLFELQSRTCSWNIENHDNKTVYEVAQMCGLREKVEPMQLQNCCYCQFDDKNQSLILLQPCQHFVHPQCLRDYHEFRIRSLFLEENQDHTQVKCPICTHPVSNITIEQLIQHTKFPEELKRYDIIDNNIVNDKQNITRKELFYRHVLPKTSIKRTYEPSENDTEQYSDMIKKIKK